MRHIARLMWLMVIACGAALGRWYFYGPWWDTAGHDVARFGPQPIMWTWAWVLLLMATLLVSRRSRKAVDVVPGRKRRQLGLGTLLLAVTAIALALGLGKWFIPEWNSKYRTVPEILAGQAYHGYELVKGPDRPGPFEEMGADRGGMGEPVSGSFWAKGKSCRFRIPAAPGEDFCVVGLLPPDDGPTYMVLKRRK